MTVDQVPYWWCPVTLVLGVVAGGVLGYVRGHGEGVVDGWFEALDQIKHWRQGTSK